MKVMTTLLGRSAAIAALTLALPVAAPAQTPKAGVVTTLHGTATVARASAPAPTPLKFRDDVFARDRITTGEQSIVRILLGGKAVVTVRERSDLTITETATTSTLEVGSGKIALAVNKDRMRPGESVDIRTPNAVAAIRGTTVVAEVAPAIGGAGLTSRFTLLTGLIDVTPLDPATGRPSGPAVGMIPLQTLSITGAAIIGTPRNITRTEAHAVTSDLKPRLKDPSKDANREVISDQVDQAARHAAALTGEGVQDAAKDANRSDRTDNGVALGNNGRNAGNSGSGTGGRGGLTTVGGATGSLTNTSGSLTNTSGGLTSGTGGLTSGSGISGSGISGSGISGSGLAGTGISGSSGSGGLVGGVVGGVVRTTDRLLTK